MVTTLGIIGAGMIGGTLARLAAGAGIEVVISNSRGPDTLRQLVDGLGERVTAATPVEAARAGDIVVASIPLGRHTQLPGPELVGKTVIDTLNYYPQRDGRIPELDTNALTSSELVQRHLTDSKVVKAFNNIAFYSLGMMARPSGSPDRSALPIAGDDSGAKEHATALLDALGYDTIDVGALAESWRIEPNSAAYVEPYLPGPMPPVASEAELFEWIGKTPVVPVPAQRVKHLTDTAVRGRAGGTFPPRPE